MSVANEPETAGPHDPMHYAPRRLREKPEPRVNSAEDMRAAREKRLEAVIGRNMNPPAPLDTSLENAVYESLRRPIDPKLLGETRALTREFERRGSSVFGVAGRIAAAVVVSAIIALFFVVMMPARQQDNTASFATTVQSFTTALSQQPSQPLPAEDAKKPALAEFQSLLAASDTAQAAEREQTDKQSDKLLQQFVQWRQNQKTNPNEPAQ
jgi:hypothetical protein